MSRSFRIGLVSAAIAVWMAGPDYVAAGDLRHLRSGHLSLWTDLPASKEIDALPRVFDLAVDQWCRYFGVPVAKAADWQVRGCLMRSADAFRAAGRLPDGLPAFRNGYSRDDEVWVYDQTSDYYRRHLLLHEGTHAFMQRFLGGTGPPWYAEGMAELLATHRWDGSKLMLAYYPRERSEVSKWGRIEIIERGFAAGSAKRLSGVMAYGSRAHLEMEPYGWCWGAAALLDGDRRYRDPFRKAIKLVQQPDFNDRLKRRFGSSWDRLQEDWQIFVANVDYGYDFERMATQLAPGEPIPTGGRDVQVAADRGWQSSGVRLEAGKTYRIEARGRYQIAAEPRVWWCEPGGVTIDYYHGQPLGILVAAVRPDDLRAGDLTPLVRPQVVGLSASIAPRTTGTLYLRINDRPSSLGDNAGTLSVQVREFPHGAQPAAFEPTIK